MSGTVLSDFYLDSVTILFSLIHRLIQDIIMRILYPILPTWILLLRINERKNGRAFLEISFPMVTRGSGSDIFIDNLASVLNNLGVDTEIQRIHSIKGLYPPIVEMNVSF
jgi:hypothetical protein